MARHWFLGRLAALNGAHLVHVLHIYKTGGTALKHALATAMPARFRVLSHKHSVTLGCIPPGQKFVFFVRDPAARFVSAFYDRRRFGRPRYDTPWSPEEARLFARFATPNALAEALDGGPDAANAEEGMASLARITRPLSSWVGSPDTLVARRNDILLIGQQETLSDDFERLKTLLGLSPTLRLPSDAVEAHLGEKDDPYLSPTAQTALRDWFAEDYAFLARLRAEGLLLPLPATHTDAAVSTPLPRSQTGR